MVNHGLYIAQMMYQSVRLERLIFQILNGVEEIIFHERHISLRISLISAIFVHQVDTDLNKLRFVIVNQLEDMIDVIAEIVTHDKRHRLYYIESLEFVNSHDYFFISWLTFGQFCDMRNFGVLCPKLSVIGATYLECINRVFLAYHASYSVFIKRLH